MKKVSIIGAGNVGSLTAMRIAGDGLGDVFLVDVVKGLAHGKALDLEDARPLLKYNYKFQWKHLLPSRRDGFLLRYILLHNKDGRKISRDNISLIKLMKAAKGVKFVTAKEMVESLERERDDGCHRRQAYQE